MQDKSHCFTGQNLSEVKERVLATLAYFDMFDYPLTRGEVLLFLSEKYAYELFETALQCLLDSGAVFKFEKYYSLKNDQSIASRRLKGNKKAAVLLKIAVRVSKLLIQFPYVRAIGISGSLSKNFADDHSDIDLFIITAKNRLWIARSLMHCLKKFTFLINKEHYFCMNYYVDEQQLEIAEKNIYTAIEVGTLIPLEGDIVFERFYSANSWTRGFLPNKNLRIASARPARPRFLKWFIEHLFNSRFGNFVDDVLMRLTTSRWQKKTRLNKVNSRGHVLGMSTGKHHAKPDPVNFQANLLARYELKASRLLKAYESL